MSLIVFYTHLFILQIQKWRERDSFTSCWLEFFIQIRYCLLEFNCLFSVAESLLICRYKFYSWIYIWLVLSKNLKSMSFNNKSGDSNVVAIFRTELLDASNFCSLWKISLDKFWKIYFSFTKLEKILFWTLLQHRTIKISILPILKRPFN